MLCTLTAHVRTNLYPCLPTYPYMLRCEDLHIYHVVQHSLKMFTDFVIFLHVHYSNCRLYQVDIIGYKILSGTFHTTFKKQYLT